MPENKEDDDRLIEESELKDDETWETDEKEYSVGEKRRRSSVGSSTAIKVVFGIVAACVLIMLAYVLVSGDQDSPVETSDVTEYQEGISGSGFGNIAPVSPPETNDEGFDFGPIQDQLESQRTALEERNSRLQAQVQQLQDSLADLSNRADGGDNSLVSELSQALQETQEQNAKLAEQMRDEFANQIQSIRAENEERMSQQSQMLESLRRENQALQTEIAAASNNAALEAQQAEAERRRQQQQEADLAERRRQQQEELAARVRSDSVIFDKGSNSGGGNASAGGASGTAAQPNSRNPSRDAALRDFVTGGGAATPTEQAQVIANPSYTVLQGTMIQATLENAVDSSLPGAVSAVVNFPIWSFDQSQVLIPSGSRLFGSYSSDVSIGQGRILVGWNRLVTPDGQSVQLSAFGGDQMGRSGITGRVNTRFGTRFGNAALISLIGAGPSIAAAQIDDDATSQIARDMTEDLSDATNSAIAAYATLPPIITVEQGTSITVMVDRDLEFF